MTVRVLGVHGVGNFSDRHSDGDRRRTWREAIVAGFGHGPVPEIDVEVAYYAPALHLGVAQGPLDIEQMSVSDKRDVWAWLVATGLPSEFVAQGQGTKPIRQGLEWFARRYGLDRKIVERFVTIFFREVGTYFATEHHARRSEAALTVARAIQEFEPHVIMAHSLGSVVAYEALWRHPVAKLELLTTLGSPLAIPTVVYDRLIPSPAENRPQKPPGVNQWVNVADPGDFISIPRPLSRYFAGVDVDLEPSIHFVDFHSASRYLSSPTVAALIASLARA